MQEMALIETVDSMRRTLEQWIPRLDDLLDRAVLCDYRESQPWVLQEVLAQAITGLDSSVPGQARELQRWISRAELHGPATVDAASASAPDAAVNGGARGSRKSWVIQEPHLGNSNRELPPPTEHEARALRYLSLPSMPAGQSDEPADLTSGGENAAIAGEIIQERAGIAAPQMLRGKASATAVVEPLAARVRATIPSRFGAELHACRGTGEAVVLARKRLPRLKLLTVCRFLSLIGYEIAVPWPDAMRLAADLTIWRRNAESADPAAPLPAKSSARTGDADLISYTAALQDAARASAVSIAQLNGLFSLYSGAVRPDDGTVICGPRAPQCSLCKLTLSCERYKLLPQTSAASSAAKRPSMNGKTDGDPAKSGIKGWAADERPRERLLAGERLSNSELLAIILRTGSGQKSAVELARLILTRFETLHDLERASAQEIMERMRGHGIGPAKAAEICAAMELGRRIAQPAADRRAGMRQVTSSRDIFELCRPRYKAATQEEFLLLVLNTKNRVQKEVAVSLGTLNSSIVHPRDVFRHALREAAAAVIFVHNHPSGDPSPSQEDILLTARLVDAGKLLGIQVLDHVIIGSHEWYSFADHGRLTAPG